MEPPQPYSLFLGLLPAFVAAGFSGADALLGGLSYARLSALHDTLSGVKKWALGRYLNSVVRMRARWLVLAAAGLASSVGLLTVLGVEVTIGTLASVGVYSATTLLVCALGSRAPEAGALRLLTLSAPFDLLVSPVVDPFVFVLTAVGATPWEARQESEQQESEMEILVNEGERSGVLNHDQSEMLRNVLDFSDLQVEDLMIPRTQVTAVSIETSPDEVLRLVVEHEHSRYPVYQGRIDNVIGVLHLKDLFLFTASKPVEALDLRKLLRKASFVPESQLASTTLHEMRADRHHMSIVIDEYGGMSGVVTLEDLLEQIVGDIRDEYDDDEPSIVELNNGRYMVDASVAISELSRQVGIELPDDGEYHSLGGFIVDEMGRVPEPGAVLETGGLKFTIRTADDRRISKVEIGPTVALAPTAAAV